MVISVIMNVDDPVELGIFRHVEFGVTLDAFGQGLPGVFLHLDIKEFPGKTNTYNDKILAPLRIEDN